jgi:uncharacterized membrane protein
METTVAEAKDAAALAGQVGWVRLFHVFGAVAYLGGILAVSRILALLPSAEEALRRGAASLARRAYLTVALPGLVVLLLAGLHTAFADPLGRGYFRQPWFHMKLTLVVLLLAVDHLLLLRPLKAVARGEGEGAVPGPLVRVAFWMIGLLAFALLLTLFVLRKA